MHRTVSSTSPMTAFRFTLRGIGSIIMQQRWLLVEWVILLGVWYLCYGRIWDGTRIPTGAEYARSISPFFFWEQIQSCVACGFWAPHGGGKPMLADPFGSFLHPIAMFSSLALGAVAGASFTLAAAFLMLGASALWLTQMLGLHPVVRVWFAIASMLGGHVVARLELGSVGMPLSLAALCVAFVTLYWYLRAPSAVRAVLLGVAVGSLLTAGQMYYQYFFVLSIVVLWVVLRWRAPQLLPTLDLGHLLCAGGIAVLMVSPLVVNLVMTAGIYAKEADTEVKYVIPIHIQLLNFLIPTPEVARTDKLNPFPFVWAYASYIGFLPVLAAYSWYGRIRVEYRRFGRVVLGMVVLAMTLATGIFSKIAIALDNDALSSIAGGFRFVIIYNGISGIGLLLLAALAVDGFLSGPAADDVIERALRWLSGVIRADARLIAVTVIALYALIGLHRFAQPFVNVQKPFDDTARQMVRDVTPLRDGYIDMPDWLFVPAQRIGLRAAVYASSVTLADRRFPPSQYMLTQKVPDAFPTTEIATYPGDWKLLKNAAPDQQYAFVRSNDGTVTPCVHTAIGGEIAVRCVAPANGLVQVFAHAVPGWTVRIDNGAPQPVAAAEWLQVPVPAGEHIIAFRYAPWYAWFGFGLLPLTWLAIGFAGGWALRTTKNHPARTLGDPADRTD